MTNYDSTLDLSQAADLLRQCPGEIVILTHAKPDGDAFGCVLALLVTLRAMGKEASGYVVPPIPASLLTLPGADHVHILGKDLPRGAPPADPGLIVIVDTGARSQLGPLWPYVEKHLDRTFILDHHLAGDVAARYRFIDSTAAAAAEPLADLLQLLPVPPAEGRGEGDAPRDAAPIVPTALYTALASDTGWFRFSSTSPRTFHLAARLLEAGVDHADLFRRLEQTERPAKLRLLARALASLELLENDQAALMVLCAADFVAAGAREDETDRIIDMPQMVGAVQAVALVTERDGGTLTAVSFRSKPGPSAINVADLAGRFGGGGHARAAGAKIHAPLHETLPKIRAALVAAAADQGGGSGKPVASVSLADAADPAEKM